MPAFRLGRLNGEFVVTWWEDGRRRRFRLGTTDRGDAERKARDVARLTVDRIVPTAGNLWAAYCDENRAKPAITTMGYEWRAMASHFSPLRPDEITVETCRAYADVRRARGIRDGSIWTELGHLRTVLTWAVKRGHIATAPYIERPTKPAPRDRHLTRDEARRLIEAAGAPHVRLAIILMLGTAGRIGAILDLTWDRVDFDRGLISLALSDGVTRKGRATVPMSGMTRAALTEARAGALTDHVIEYAGEPVASIKNGFRGAVARAGLADVTPHVLRHTAAVWLAEAGKPMTEIAQYLGHSDSRLTERVYARYSPTHLRGAAEILDFIAPQVRQHH
jgi:integrase